MGKFEKYVAEAAMDGLLNIHGQILKDEVWDSIYRVTEDEKVAKLLAVQELQGIVDVIAGMLEIRRLEEDEVLVKVYETGMQEIAEMFGE